MNSITNQTNPDFDVAIIGGGPAGSSLAAYLAKADISCVVLESELFPRPHVGESLVPSSTRVFKELDFLDQMEEARFPHKYGAVWTAAESDITFDHGWDGLTPDCRADIRFDERAQEGVDQNYTYHVDRGKFDLLLLQHARKLGAKVWSGVSVMDANFPKEAFPELTLAIGSKKIGIKTRLIVDASGRRTFLGSKLKLKVNDPVFDQYAIHTWFEGYDRKSSENADYIFIHFLPLTNSWIWQIPITDSITSFGVVTQKKYFEKTAAGREKFFWDCVATRPEILERLEAAKQIRPFSAEGDYSYAMKEICGDGFVLIGDAARFVDPIFSSGVSVALNSARFASHDIIATLKEGGVFTRQSFKRYEMLIRRGTSNWYEFISLYYRLNILFTAFINDPEYRLDILKLLQGDVYDDDAAAVLKKMREVVTIVENDKTHLWHNRLGDLTANTLGAALT